jgi:hypothetical protein
MCAFALMSTKAPTPVYPATAFEPSALARFVAEAPGTPGIARPAEVHVQPASPARPARAGCLLILPPAVAHSIPNAPHAIECGAAASEQGALLSSEGAARWFCRVSLEVVPAPPPHPLGGSQAGGGAGGAEGAWGLWQREWPGGPDTRRRVALLAARHVWGDADFAEQARAAMGLDMAGWGW